MYEHFRESGSATRRAIIDYVKILSDLTPTTCSVPSSLFSKGTHLQMTPSSTICLSCAYLWLRRRDLVCYFITSGDKTKLEKERISRIPEVFRQEHTYVASHPSGYFWCKFLASFLINSSGSGKTWLLDYWWLQELPGIRAQSQPTFIITLLVVGTTGWKGPTKTTRSILVAMSPVMGPFTSATWSDLRCRYWPFPGACLPSPTRHAIWLESPNTQQMSGAFLPIELLRTAIILLRSGWCADHHWWTRFLFRRWVVSASLVERNLAFMDYGA